MEDNAFELWKRQKQEEKLRKYREQEEIREMMEKYWPWEHERTRPRAKTNLFVEEIFPVEEYGKVKRVTEIPEVYRSRKRGNKHQQQGKKIQGSKDTSASSIKSQKAENVTNEIEFQKEDKGVESKENNSKLNTRNCWNKPDGNSNWKENIGVKFLKSLGWSDNNTLKNLAMENKPLEINKNLDIKDVNPKLIAIREYSKNLGDRSPYSDVHTDGVELVRVLAKNRNPSRKCSLNSTDITKIMKNRVECDHDYFQKLRSQVNERNELIKTSILEDFEQSKQHFNTWDSFWGRPGHGAPLNVRKKLRLDNLLYPHTRPG